MAQFIPILGYVCPHRSSIGDLGNNPVRRTVTFFRKVESSVSPNTGNKKGYCVYLKKSIFILSMAAVYAVQRV